MRQILDADPAIRDLIWDDTKIPASGNWRKEIMDHMARARVMIMLGSPDYFAPDCGAAELEIKPALEAYHKGEMSILWFRVRDHSISTAPVRDIMAATGPGAAPLEMLPPDEQDTALRQIYQQVLRILGRATDTMNIQPKRFRIALSFPGEQRAFVEQVAEQLASQIGRDRLLYDKYYEAEFARPDLDTYLQRLYHDESELIAVFLCADYERKDWCGLEWRALRDLIKRRQSSSIMPLRFDNTEIPGLFSTDGYVWIGGRIPKEIADLILQRWQINTGQTGVKLATPGTPASPTSPAPPAIAARIPSPALSLWQKKLAFLQAEEAKAAEAEQKFAIQQRIEECKEKIREFGGQS